MNMLQSLLALAGLSLLFAAACFILLLNAGGRMDPGLLYLFLSVAGLVCACFFVGLAFLVKICRSSPKAGKKFWEIVSWWPWSL